MAEPAAGTESGAPGRWGRLDALTFVDTIRVDERQRIVAEVVRFVREAEDGVLGGERSHAGHRYLDPEEVADAIEREFGGPS